MMQINRNLEKRRGRQIPKQNCPKFGITFGKTKKSLAQEVRQKRDISEVRVEGRFVPFNPYFVCNTAIGSLCDLYGSRYKIKKIIILKKTDYGTDM